MIISKRNISFILFFALFISIALYYFQASTQHEKAIIESVLFLFASIMAITFVATSKNLFVITHFEFAVISFIAYIAFRNLFLYSVYTSIVEKIFLIILYFGQKNFLSKNKTHAHLILITATIAIILSYLFFAFNYLRDRREDITNLYLLNQSIFGILLASLISLIIPLILRFRTKNMLFGFAKSLVCVIVSASVILLFFTNSRSGWLGFSLAVVYIVYCILNNSRVKKIFLYFTLPISIAILSLLFWYKQDSSKGRLLVYKVSAEMLKDNWLFGIGGGQFKVQYNQNQAAYFTTHDIDSKEAMLADNTFYAFNDFFQLIIENGVIGLLFLLVIIYLFIRQVKKIITNDKNNHLFIAATASLICIVVGGLVSYPLQIFPIVFQFIVCLAIINTYSSADKIRIELPEKLKRIPIIIFALLGFYLIVYFYSNFQFSRKNLEAFEFERMGYRQNALKVYKELGNSVIKDGNMLYSYAKALYYSNQPIRAAQVLKVAKKYYCSNAVYKLSAQINQELGNHHQAEKDYQTAVYMVPNRMISRYDLLNYYIEQKDTSNIIYWSHSIAKMPVKVPSQLAKGLQMKAKTILFQYNKRNSLDSIK